MTLTLLRHMAEYKGTHESSSLATSPSTPVLPGCNAAKTGPHAHQEVTDPAVLAQLHVTITASGVGQISAALVVLNTTLLLSSDSCS